MKSKWKLKYFSIYFNNNVHYTKNRSYPLNNLILNSRYMIPGIFIHNGKTFYKLSIINKKFSTFKLGFFLKTRKKPSFKKKKKKKINKVCVDLI